MRAALFLIGGDNVSKWLVVFPHAEFIVYGNDILDARRAVEIEALRRGIRNRREYDMFRLGV